ncbi:hypothetical protein Q5W_15430 [Hydrogenophaga sp. PBC]|uniref:hypothetical protein n=1 Tax=Hydrogenophaga sp. PBC TaxID=795665 RepID=UPI0002606A51|nr:hypothetical protein [Hydrogenophaga sp. PBC]AOS80261.1 hypothetical protein Q5W_15430 [Hydrogenophaga sp. PBC]
MSEVKLKVGDEVEVVATATGFRNGRLVYPGTKFKATVVEGKKGPRLPKWVQPANQPLKPKTERKNGDLKPIDAQAAVKQKAAELNGEQPPGDNLA